MLYVDYIRVEDCVVGGGKGVGTERMEGEGWREGEEGEGGGGGREEGEEGGGGRRGREEGEGGGGGRRGREGEGGGDRHIH